MIPASLRRWFVLHAALDLAFALPLFFAPEAFLGLLGWQHVDPVASRLVAAALFGIGAESWLGRKNGLEGYFTMLTLKVVWSAAAALGVTFAALTGGPPLAWAIVGIFASFHVVWLRYWFQLRRGAS